MIDLYIGIHVIFCLVSLSLEVKDPCGEFSALDDEAAVVGVPLDGLVHDGDVECLLALVGDRRRRWLRRSSWATWWRT